jgi:hypothetical protein
MAMKQNNMILGFIILGFRLEATQPTAGKCLKSKILNLKYKMGKRAVT